MSVAVLPEAIASPETTADVLRFTVPQFGPGTFQQALTSAADAIRLLYETFMMYIPVTRNPDGTLSMTQPSTATIESLLVANLTREVVMGVEDALEAGARRAFSAASGMDEGHLPHVVGQLRHFHMNEAFHRALSANEASPSAIKGNGLVTGRAGMLTLARFNIPQGFWINGRRSHTRRQMALANAALEPLVQPGLFSTYQPPSDAVAFFVACFSGNLNFQPECPLSIQIAVPSRDMRGWLFKEPLNDFIKRYEAPAIIQTDLAVPKLKKGQSKQLDKDGTAP